jgi:hypothetical protein
VDNEILKFEQWCRQSWGKTLRNNKLLFASNTPQIRQYEGFENMKNSLKMHIAEKLIFESCRKMGVYIGSGDVKWYIYNFGKEFQGDVDGFGGRITQPLKAALLLIAFEEFSSALPSDRSDCDHIFAGGAALSAMYLMSRLENLFRIKSQYLNEDGTLKKKIPEQLRKQIVVNNIGPRWRCNRISQSFKIFLYRNKNSLGKQLKIMDRKLRIADRLDKTRHPAMHGELKDPSSEARFLALLIAMFYYGVPLNKITLTAG